MPTLRTVIKVILYSALQETQFGCSVLNLTWPFAGHDFTLSSPPFDIAPSEHLVRLPLADKFGVVMVGFQQLNDSRRKVVQKCVIRD